MSIQQVKQWTTGIITLVIVVSVLGCFFGLMGKNNEENYQIIQSLNGTIKVRDKAGYYPKIFATVTTYPRAVQVYYSADAEEGGSQDRSVRATFNDGGTAQISTVARFRMPTSETDRVMVHREFTANVKNIEAAVRAHLLNCIKATGPLMTSSENQTSRKAEFAKVIGDQMQDGLYQFNRVNRAVTGIDGIVKKDERGNTITIAATQIVTNDDGMPNIDSESPLKQYGIEIVQFSITKIDYDKQTIEQFAKKKDASLKAELAKIQVEQAIQETKQQVEEGKKNKAIKEAEMNVKVAEAKGAAEMKVAQAMQAKEEAAQLKEKALIEANQRLEVADIEYAASQKEAQKIIELAKAAEQEIALAGKITEREQVLAEIAAKRDAMVAEALSKLKLPTTVWQNNGGSTGGSGSGQLFEALGVNATLDLMKKMNNSEVTIATK
jgi:hypothetical protein